MSPDRAGNQNKRPYRNQTSELSGLHMELQIKPLNLTREYKSDMK